MGQLDSVTDPRHAKHSLKLYESRYNYRCDGCKEPGVGARYRCNTCDFDLHPACIGQSQNAQPSKNKSRGLLKTLSSVGGQFLVPVVLASLGVDVGDIISGGDDAAEA